MAKRPYERKPGVTKTSQMSWREQVSSSDWEILKELGVLTPEEEETDLPENEHQIIDSIFKDPNISYVDEIEIPPDWIRSQPTAQPEQPQTEVGRLLAQGIGPEPAEPGKEGEPLAFPERREQFERQIIPGGGPEGIVREYRQYSKAKKAARSFTAGVAGLEDIAGGAMIYAGWDSMGETVRRRAQKKIRNMAVRELYTDFKWEDLGDPDFYVTKGARMIPSLMALIPVAIGGGAVGAGVAGAVGLGAKGAWIATVLSSALASRPMESGMEAMGTYNELMDSGYSKEQAAEGAATTFWGNMALMPLDMSEFALAFMKVPPGMRGPLAGFIRNKGIRIAGRGVAAGVGMVMEGYEEVLQNFFQDLGRKSATGEMDASLWETLKLSRPEDKEAFALGAVGHAGYQVVGTAARRMKLFTPTEVDDYINNQAEEVKPELEEAEPEIKVEKAPEPKPEVTPKTPEKAPPRAKEAETREEVTPEAEKPAEAVTEKAEVAPAAKEMPAKVEKPRRKQIARKMPAPDRVTKKELDMMPAFREISKRHFARDFPDLVDQLGDIKIINKKALDESQHDPFEPEDYDEIEFMGDIAAMYPEIRNPQGGVDFERLMEKALAELRRKQEGTLEAWYTVADEEVPFEVAEMQREEAEERELIAQVSGVEQTEAFREGRKKGKQNLYKQIHARQAKAKDTQRAIIDYANKYLTKPDRTRISLLAGRVKTPRGMQRVLDMIDKMEEKYQRREAEQSLKKTVRKLDIKRLRPEYKTTVEQIVGTLDVVKHGKKTIAKLERLADFIERNPDHNIPPEKLSRLKTLAKTQLQELTTEDLNLIRDSISHLVKLNQLKNKILYKRKARDFKKVLSETVTNIRQKDPVEIDPREGIKVSKLREIFGVKSWNAERITRILDSEKPGTITEVLYNGIDQGVTALLQFKQEADDYFRGKLGDLDMIRWSETYHTKRKQKKNVDYHSYKLDSGRSVKLTKGERIALYLHAKNTNSLRHLLAGGFRFRKNLVSLYKLTAEDLDNITGSLTAEEITAADAIHEYLNTIQKKKINEVSVALNGWEVATEEDYFPISIHGVDIQRAYLTKGETLPTDMRGFTRSTLEGMGILKARVKTKNPIVLEDAFAATYKSIKQISSYYGLAEPLRSAKAVLMNDKVRVEMARSGREHYWRALSNYLKDMEGEYQRTDLVDELTRDLVNRLDIATLGVNPFVMTKQLVSFVGAATEIDSKYLAKAAKHVTTDADIDAIMKNSPQLRDRHEGNVSRELGEISQVGEARSFWTHKATLGQHMMRGIREFDYKVIARIWKAAEYETNDLHSGLKGEERTAHITERAEEIIRLTQPTFHVKDRSEIGRSRQTFARLWTRYSSQRNKNYMMLQKTISEYNHSDHSAADKLKFTKKIMLLVVVMPLMIAAIDEIRRKLYGYDKERDWKKYLALNTLANNVGNVYYVSPAFYSFISKAEKGTYAGYDMNNILVDWGQSGIDAAANLWNAIDQGISGERYDTGTKAGQKKWKYSLQRTIDQGLSFGGRGMGYPYNTGKRLLQIPIRLSGLGDEEIFGMPISPTRKTKKKKSKFIPTIPE